MALTSIKAEMAAKRSQALKAARVASWNRRAA
jgi:hypothetical protein